MSAAELEISNPDWLTGGKKRLVPVLDSNALHVLMIEDSREYAALVTKALKNQNLCEFEVDRAARLDVGIQKLEHVWFDAVLLDLTLPDANAETSIERVCSRVSESPVIVLTGSKDTHLALLAGQAGADAFLLKDRLDRKTLPRKILDLIVQKHSKRPYDVSLEMSASAIEMMALLEHAIPAEPPASSRDPVPYPDENIFCDRLAHTIAQARINPRRFAVLNLRLDHLDILANLAGRSFRNEMIETAYLQLRDRISTTDTLAQVGEASFALILDDVENTGSINETAQALSACISCTRVLGESVSRDIDSIGMTASIGVAMYPDDGRDLESLLCGAEEAQLIAAQLGDSAVQFCRELDLYQDYLEKPKR